MVLSSQIIANVDSQFYSVHLSIRTLPSTTPYIYILLWYNYERFSSAKIGAAGPRKFSQNWSPLQILVPFLKCKLYVN